MFSSILRRYFTLPGNNGLDTNGTYTDANTELAHVTVGHWTIGELQQDEANLPKSMDDLQPSDQSPFQRLPYDIVGEILLACMDTYAIMDPGHAPLLFLSISRSIRQVALSQPRIWSGVLINCSGRIFRLQHGTAKAALFLSTLKEWLLVRSADVPLNIKVEGYLDVSSSDTMGDSILDILLACMRRWRALTVCLSGPRCKDMPAFNGADFPYLQYFAFSSSADNAYTALLKSDFFHAPKLQGLKLRQYPQTSPLPSVLLALPWSKLTFLDLESVRAPVFPMLRQATSLIYLRLRSIDQENIGTEPLTCPFLASIEFKDRSSAKTAALLQLLDAPNLTSLKLYNNHPVGDDFASIVQRFPRLATLDIYMVDMFSFRDVLIHTPNLTTLSFRHSDDGTFHIFFTNVFLCSFISDDYGPRLCPKLEVFYCGVPLELDDRMLRLFFRKKQRSIDGMAAWKFCGIRNASNYPDKKIQRLYERLVTEAKFEYLWPVDSDVDYF